ncbi:MAG: hypothetical protein JW754_05665 [Candidatus Aenigmarchaeota archaeon]|nr:hypothetical protein [Candidatus Aenigmarchaeota archaeon]
MTSKCYLGVGIYESYLDNLPKYLEAMKPFETRQFIIADSIQEFNRSIRDGEEVEELSEEILHTYGNVADENRIELIRWDEFAERGNFKKIYDFLRNLYNEDPDFRERVRRVPYRKTGTPTDHDSINEISEYCLSSIGVTMTKCSDGFAKIADWKERQEDKITRGVANRICKELGMTARTSDMEFVYID